MTVPSNKESPDLVARGAEAGAFPIVGIGASAGGLAAFEAFFSGMPADADPGMAFVLVQHLAPDHKSMLTDLIRHYTRMQVFEVEDGMVVQINCAYIIPPGHDMAFLNGTLQLLPPAEPRGQRLPIDFFFRSLAQDQHAHAIGIVLSGTGSDGTQGLRAIKAEGGMAMAQNLETAEFDGMPRSAIATGLVDYELAPAEMPEQLIAYTGHAFGKLPRVSTAASHQIEQAMGKVYVLLRSQTRHDFSLYKPSTIHRRIERRMAVHQIDSLDSYVKYLQQSPTEIEALFRDLLIGVTSFFRDPDVFTLLQLQVIPKLFAGKSPGESIRAWTTGCATGEEAYSIAILLVEHMEALKASFAVQLFATDIDAQAIATARAGLYPTSIETDVSAERLARFFKLEPDGSGYRIHKGIRDLLVFSEQSVIKDPPFSRLDLISCRNLLIYMGAELQRKLIPLFHYALKPGGWLLLGSSEGVGDHDALFAVVDRKAKVFQRLELAIGTDRRAPGQSSAATHALDAATHAQARIQPARGLARPAGSSGTRSLRETTEQALLAQVIAAGALVDGAGDIHYLHGRTGMFLEPSPGEAGVNNILKMARDGLRRDLTASLQKSARTLEVVTCLGLRVKTNGHFSDVNLTVRPVAGDAAAQVSSALFLVVLEVVPEVARAAAATGERPEAEQASATMSPDAQARIAELKAELRLKDDSLRSAGEDLASSTEELRSANEEMQSVNEELQSTNEELETSKEELQSVNEELATVNTELQAKVTDLSRANNDMNNLLAGTGIGTVFVDHQLRILRFTPAASAIINLIPGDLGRPVAHIVSNLIDYSSLVPDMQAVLRTLVPRELTVTSRAGKNYTMRIQPYRTLDNVIEGAVISFVDITERQKIQDRLLRTTELLERTGALAKVGGWDLEVSEMALSWTPETFRIHDLDPAQPPSWAQAMAFYDPQAQPVVQAGLQAAIDHGTPWSFELPLTTAKGRAVWVRAQGVAEVHEGKTVRLFGALQDITERKQVEEALRLANERLLAAG